MSGAPGHMHMDAQSTGAHMHVCSCDVVFQFQMSNSNLGTLEGLDFRANRDVEHFQG